MNIRLKKNNIATLFSLFFFLSSFFFLLFSCTFDYGDEFSSDIEVPDLVMENVEYVRVRSAEPVARFQADRAERWEEQNLMLLENLSFEQFGSSTDEINAQGTAGSAVVETDSGNILMENGVRIEVESEELVIETQYLEWIDDARTLSTREDDEVNISMNNGTSFTGIGFFANARNRTWEFVGGVEGEYIFEDDENETKKTEKTGKEYEGNNDEIPTE